MRIKNNIYYIFCDTEYVIIDLGSAFRNYRKIKRNHFKLEKENANMADYYFKNLFKKVRRK